MRFEDQEPFSPYTDTSEQAAHGAQPEPQEYYTARQCTPMGSSRRTRRRGGVIVGLVIVLLLAAAAFSVVQLLQQIDVRLDRENGGFSLSVLRRGDARTPEDAPNTPDVPADAPVEEATPPATEENTAQAAESVQNKTDPVSLTVQPSPAGEQAPLSEVPGALSLQEIYQKLSPSVVSIVTSLQSGSATGTGIIMSADGYIITNHHVIEDASQITVVSYDDAQYPAALVGSDAISDLAVLRIEAEGLTAAEFGDSDALRVGDAVVAIGDPLGIQLRGTMTNGIVSAINRDLTVEDRKMTLIQTNAALNSGNSGGPLINCYGQVIGINTMKMSSYYSSASVEGLGFAIPIKVAKPIIDELIENGYVSGRPAIGINGEAMPEYARLYYRLPKGVYITYVSETSDAYRKGIREGDILTAVNDTEVSTLDEVNAVKNQFSAGDTLTLTIFRSGKYYSAEIILMDQALQ